MRDPTTQPRGRTRWRRFGIAFGPAMGLVITALVLMMTGVLALPITISGVQFTVKADKLVDNGSGPGEFKQWGDVDNLATGGGQAVAVSDIAHGADLGGLTQTVCGPTGLASPFPTHIQLVITADDANATGDLQVDLVGPNALTTGANMTSTFQSLVIGALVPTRGTTDGTNTEPPLTFGQTANSFNITNPNVGTEFLQQTAVYTSAGTFALKHLGLAVSAPSAC
ncbi:MAG TPA: DUF6230 family protein [Candidatus Dormibacteraeota bacterium]|nr:DUF6230 family protein [Candidatus Dormibacteraeota bacterium]